MRQTLAVALALLAAPALAETAMDVAEFEALVEGRTLTYAAGGAPYGIEHYHAGRRVTWAWVETKECHAGEWYAKGPEADPTICFVYDYDPTPECWKFYREGEGVRAVSLEDDGSTSLTLYETAEAPGGLVCGDLVS